MPSMPWMKPAVGKSGPGITAMRSFTWARGFSIVIRQASMTSPRLCGGMFVAMPTAMPQLPFTRRLGNLAGSTLGSRSEPSDVGQRAADDDRHRIVEIRLAHLVFDVDGDALVVELGVVVVVVGHFVGFCHPARCAESGWSGGSVRSPTRPGPALRSG